MSTQFKWFALALLAALVIGCNFHHRLIIPTTKKPAEVVEPWQTDYRLFLIAVARAVNTGVAPSHEYLVARGEAASTTMDGSVASYRDDDAPPGGQQANLNQLVSGKKIRWVAKVKSCYRFTDEFYTFPWEPWDVTLDTEGLDLDEATLKVVRELSIHFKAGNVWYDLHPGDLVEVTGTLDKQFASIDYPAKNNSQSLSIGLGIPKASMKIVQVAEPKAEPAVGTPVSE